MLKERDWEELNFIQQHFLHSSFEGRMWGVGICLLEVATQSSVAVDILCLPNFKINEREITDLSLANG